MDRTEPHPSSPLRLVMAWAPVAVAAMAAAVLVGWALDATWMTQLRPTWPAMTPSTAVGLLLGAVAVHPAIGAGRRAARAGALAAGVALVALASATLVGHLTRHPTGAVSDALAALGFARFADILGPSPATAVSLALLGAAALMWLVRTRPWPVQHALALTAASLGYVALIGYVLHISVLYAPPDLPPGVGMAAHTAIGVLLLAFTLLGRWLHHLRTGRSGQVRVVLSALGLAGLLAAVALVPLTTTAGATVLVLVLSALAALLSLLIVSSSEHTIHAQRQREAFEAMRSDFVTRVSHHIRTPLTVVAGMAELLAHHGTELAPDEAALLAQRLDRNAQQLRVLLVDLLDLSLTGQDGASLARSAVRVDRVVGALLETIDLGGRPLEVDCRPATAAVDQREFADAIGRILDNVVRHTPDGTTTRVGVEQVDQWACITVEDAGPGIPSDALARVFEPFEQGHAVSRHSPGMGFGLARVDLFAQLYGGRAWAAPSDLGGVAITVELPSTPAARRGSAARPPGPTGAAVRDDEPALP